MQQRKTTMHLSCVITAALGLGAILGAQSDETVKKLFSTKLTNAPGQALTAELVEYPPGGKSAIHHHAGSVFAYVLSGRIRSQNSATGAAKVFQAGESFFEPAGSDHLISENGSATEPARLLAIHIAKEGAVPTKAGHAK